MKKFKCEDMMCGHCVARIEEGLKGAGISHSVSLEEKSVTVNEDKDCEKAAQILDDLGFTPVEI